MMFFVIPILIGLGIAFLFAIIACALPRQAQAFFAGGAMSLMGGMMRLTAIALLGLLVYGIVAATFGLPDP